MKPLRIQLSRKSGWRMPSNTVKVDRSTAYGNPVKPKAGETNHFAVSCFRDIVRENPGFRRRIKKELRGLNLACWCALCPAHAKRRPLGVECSDCAECHVDVMLPIANE